MSNLKQEVQDKIPETGSSQKSRTARLTSGQQGIPNLRQYSFKEQEVHAHKTETKVQDQVNEGQEFRNH